ncbi:TfoX/Sxy family protein [Streptomyces sp. NPDC020681]|uniref:TfoX/Sxy family protein n=1 Tax=Streptomyces sp. NPDC020681 TaxID=3365083 RepID=UPI0037B3AEB5
MAYDEGLAQRIRDHLDRHPGITEKHMFGGLSFLYHGNMAVGVIGDEMIVRVGPEATDAALARPGARVFDFTSRPMRGWITVGAGGLADDGALCTWVDEGHAFAASLPPK